MAVKIRYKANNNEFGKLMMADQTQDLAMQGAERGARVAKGIAGRFVLPADYISSIRAEHGPTQVIGRNPRCTARTVANHRLAATFEFGSGTGRTGAGSATPRPQGGYSDPYRILGSAGALVGSPPTGGSR